MYTRDVHICARDHDGYEIETGKTSGMKVPVPSFSHSPAKGSVQLQMFI